MHSGLNPTFLVFKIVAILAIVMLCVVSIIDGCNSGAQKEFSDTDTVFVKGISDTVIVYDTTHKYVDKPTPTTKYKYVHDTVHVVGNSDILQNPCDTVRNYTDSIEDGNCKAMLNASVRGELLNWSAELFSKSTFINRVDTVKIYIKPAQKMRVGLGLAINDSLQPIGYGVMSKGSFNAIGTYNLRNKSLTLGVGINLTR